MGRQVKGMSNVGCGAFGLVGLLVGVGFVIWLSMGIGGDDDSPADRESAAEEDLGETPTPSDVREDLEESVPGLPPADATIDLAPDGPVAEGTMLTMTGTGWSGNVQMQLCLADVSRAGGGLAACHEGGEVVVPTTDDGQFVAQLPALATIDVMGKPESCREQDCILVVSEPGLPERGLTLPLELAP